MKKFLIMMAAIAGVWMMAALPASAAPALSLLPEATISQVDSSQSLITDVSHRKVVCHWHKSCKNVYTCWWRNGYKYCGWKTICKRICHKHYGASYGFYLRTPHVAVRLY